jgi:hypothetical protein
MELMAGFTWAQQSMAIIIAAMTMGSIARSAAFGRLSIKAPVVIAAMAIAGLGLLGFWTPS